LFEGANLPTELEAQEVIKEHGNFLYIPGKAANAGGVGVSGFEMTQNAQKMSWKPEVVDEKLQELMAGIYSQLVEAAGEHGTLESGANQAGFKKVVAAMEDLGWL
jgi:glutamate dehydrogenase (NADP+)